MKIDIIATVENRDYNSLVIAEPQIRIEKLFISPGHNFFGHHEKPAGNFPTVEVEEVECVAGKGLVGDRFFDFKNDLSSGRCKFKCI